MNVEWILILTVVASNGVSVTQVGPFADAASCQVAGKTWFNKTYPNFNNYRYVAVIPNYVCVQK